MRRLLQFGTITSILVAFLTPLSEYFDRWDAPGLGNDTEIGLFCLVLFICLVLLVCTVLASLAGRMSFTSIRLPRWHQVETLLDRIVSKTSSFLLSSQPHSESDSPVPAIRWVMSLLVPSIGSLPTTSNFSLAIPSRGLSTTRRSKPNSRRILMTCAMNARLPFRTNLTGSP